MMRYKIIDLINFNNSVIELYTTAKANDTMGQEKDYNWKISALVRENIELWQELKAEKLRKKFKKQKIKTPKLEPFRKYLFLRKKYEDELIEDEIDEETNYGMEMNRRKRA